MSRTEDVVEFITLNIANISTQVSGSQVDVYTLENNIANKVRSEVYSVMKTVGIKVQHAVLTAMQSLMIHRKGVAMKSANASSARSLDGNVLEPDQREFLGTVDERQFNTSTRINSHTDLSIIDETRGNITVEGVDLAVNKRNSVRQTHTHHMVT